MNLFYLHIPKAGGSTLNHILDRRFKKSEQYFFSTIRPEQSMELIHKMSDERVKQIKLYRGHFVYGFHAHFNIDNPRYFTIMRNPIDRIMSHYYYSARKTDHYLYKKRKSEDISLIEYVTKVSTEARNGMSKQIAGFYVNDNFGYGKKVVKCEDQEELYDIALNNIKNNFIMVGLMEEFDKSLALLKQLLGGKDIAYYYYRKNINKNKKNNTSYSISKKEEQIIFEYNQADIKLYNYCKKKFAKVLKRISNLSNLSYEVNDPFIKVFLDFWRKMNRLL